LMPYKLRDPGVTLKYDGEVKDSTGKVYDKLALSFENVGETPGDHYWVYVDRGNHRVERWDMVLQSDKPPPKSYTWEGWEAAGGGELALDQIWERALALGEAPLLVVTGGEPLEHPHVGELLDQAVARWPRVEVETSGVAAPPRRHERLFYNLSPKLPSAT